MTIKKYIDLGFNIDSLLLAGFQAGCAKMDDDIKNMDSTKGIALSINSFKSTPSRDLNHVIIGPIEKLSTGLIYGLGNRDNWMSVLSLFVDTVLIQQHIRTIDSVKNLTPELIQTLSFKENIRLTIASQSKFHEAGFNMLYAHSDLRKAILKSFYSLLFENDESLSDPRYRMSASSVFTILTSQEVSLQLHRFELMFKSIPMQILQSIKRIEDYLAIEESIT